MLDRFSVEERKNIGVHVCPGGDVDSVHSADVPYEELLKHLFKLNTGYFQMEMAGERDREAAYKLVGKHLREDANGVPQMAYIGVIVTQSPPRLVPWRSNQARARSHRPTAQPS
jgi:hypothetical protein